MPIRTPWSRPGLLALLLSGLLVPLTAVAVGLRLDFLPGQVEKDAPAKDKDKEPFDKPFPTDKPDDKKPFDKPFDKKPEDKKPDDKKPFDKPFDKKPED